MRLYTLVFELLSNSSQPVSFFSMKKAIERMLIDPSARSTDSIKAAAYQQSAFTPWAGDE